MRLAMTLNCLLYTPRSGLIQVECYRASLPQTRAWFSRLAAAVRDGKPVFCLPVGLAVSQVLARSACAGAGAETASARAAQDRLFHAS